MTLLDLNQIHIQVLQDKIELANLRRKKLETNKDFSMEEYSRFAKLVGDMIIKSRELKNEFASTEVTLHNYPIKQAIMDLLLEFKSRDSEFRKSFKEQMEGLKADHDYNWIMAHKDKDTEKLNYHSSEMNKIKEFLKK